MAAQLWRENEGEPSRLFLIASYVTLFIGGCVLGVVGAFMLPRAAGSAFSAAVPSGAGGAATRVVAAGGGAGLSQLLSVGLLIAVVANPLLSFAGLRTAGTRLAAFTPLFGWLIVVLPMLYTTADGDQLLPTGALRTVAFVLLGVLGFTAVGVVGLPTRGASALGRRPIAPVVPRTPPRAPQPAKTTASRTAPKRRKRR
ncbi:MAG: hypothetical protein JWN96_2446 [Mycobacterium sp.]|nr:hypothetical protein [Mycobacterium sp.]